VWFLFGGGGGGFGRFSILGEVCVFFLFLGGGVIGAEGEGCVVVRFGGYVFLFLFFVGGGGGFMFYFLVMPRGEEEPDVPYHKLSSGL